VRNVVVTRDELESLVIGYLLAMGVITRDELEADDVCINWESDRGRALKVTATATVSD
jgi:hypothetical protein